MPGSTFYFFIPVLSESRFYRDESKDLLFNLFFYAGGLRALCSNDRFSLHPFSLYSNSLRCRAAQKIQKNIMIDQFGYRPDDQKIAVVVDPKIGGNSNENFNPGSTYEVRTWDDDKVVFTGNPVEWNNGAIDFSSGDKGWWFDFSRLDKEGEYYIFDKEQNVGSYKFEISKNVYKNILKAAMHVFYYQRLNDPKKKPYAEEPWTDDAAFIGPGQDREALYVNDKQNKSLAKDLSGGWMDAGDYNKYVTFADNPIHLLLMAYTQKPKIFTDDYNIPESGNGVPDIIDEIKYELDWLKKMQEDDGGVLIKMGNIDFNISSPPSTDRRPRYYEVFIIDYCSSRNVCTCRDRIFGFPHVNGICKRFRKKSREGLGMV